MDIDGSIRHAGGGPIDVGVPELVYTLPSNGAGVAAMEGRFGAQLFQVRHRYSK